MARPGELAAYLEDVQARYKALGAIEAYRQEIIIRRTDPFLILLSARSWRQRQKAARAIAAKMPTKIADRKAYYALKGDAQGEGARWLREKVFVPALMEAARGQKRLQYFRDGQKWITDASGHKTLVRPMEYSVRFLRRWLMTRAWAIVTKKLALGRPLAPMTERQRDAIQLAAKRDAKKRGVTPDALRKRIARTAAKAARLQKRWQGGRPA
jgi:hypothetical protein